MSSSHLLEFAPFRLDLEDERLWRGYGEALALTPKAFAVLKCLVGNPGHLVTKDTLMSTVWPETAISESNLTGCIWELRQALGDSARTPTYIETVHGRGYRFIAAVVADGVALTAPETEPYQGYPSLGVYVWPQLYLATPCLALGMSDSLRYLLKRIALFNFDVNRTVSDSSSKFFVHVGDFIEVHFAHQLGEPESN